VDTPPDPQLAANAESAVEATAAMTERIMRLSPSN
jgi:hypothetical protein